MKSLKLLVISILLLVPSMIFSQAISGFALQNSIVVGGDTTVVYPHDLSFYTYDWSTALSWSNNDATAYALVQYSVDNISWSDADDTLYIAKTATGNHTFKNSNLAAKYMRLVYQVTDTTFVTSNAYLTAKYLLIPRK